MWGWEPAWGASATCSATSRGCWAKATRLRSSHHICYSGRQGSSSKKRRPAMLTFQRVPLLPRVTSCAGCPYAEARTRRGLDEPAAAPVVHTRGRRGEPAGYGREQHRRPPSRLMQILRALRGLSSLCHRCAFILTAHCTCLPHSILCTPLPPSARTKHEAPGAVREAGIESRLVQRRQARNRGGGERLREEGRQGGFQSVEGGVHREEGGGEVSRQGGVHVGDSGAHEVGCACGCGRVCVLRCVSMRSLQLYMNFFNRTHAANV